MCVDSHTVFPLTHGVRTHICWKTTLQSIFTTLYFDTFLTLCCCTTQIPVWLRDKYCPFKIHNVWLVWVESIFQYKSSDVCVDVSHCMVMLFLSLTSAVPGIYPNKILLCIYCVRPMDRLPCRHKILLTQQDTVIHNANETCFV